MKKFIYLFLFLTTFVINIEAVGEPEKNLLKFQVVETGSTNDDEDDSENSGSNDGPKSNPIPPFMSLAAPTLFIYSGCDDTTLRLIDGSDNVAFTQYIPTGTTQVVLPSTLSGTYELQIIRGQYLFYTEIEL